MSTEPSGWQAPKTNWQSADPLLPTDFNRIEGNESAIETGSRTIDPTQVPSGNVGTLRQLLDWFANRIKAITGKANWYDTPDITLATLSAHASRHQPGGADAIPTAAPSGGLGTANAVGTSTSLARADHTHLAFDNTNPAALGTAAPGTAAVAARRDHVHPKPTPADIGAVNKAGDTMTGTLVVPTLETTLGGSGIKAVRNGGALNSNWYSAGRQLELYSSNGDPVGIAFHRGGYTQVCLVADDSTTVKIWNGTTLNPVWHAGNDGAGSGLDADLLDGQHGSYYDQNPKFDPTTGHKHTGAAGDGPKLFAEGVWADTTTSIAANTEVTFNIPLGFAAKRGRLIARGGPPSVSGRSATVFFTTVENDTTSVAGTYGYGWNKGLDGDISPSGAFGDYIRLSSAYILGTNLVIKFKNTDTAAARTLTVGKLLWQVEGY